MYWQTDREKERKLENKNVYGAGKLCIGGQRDKWTWDKVSEREGGKKYSRDNNTKKILKQQ